MPNYKPSSGGGDFLDYGGFVRSLQSSDTFKRLYASATAASPLTLKDMATNSAYQVPAGKTFKIVFIDQFIDSNKLTELITSTVADSVTGLVLKIDKAIAIQNHNKAFVADIAADLYITMNPTAGVTTHTIELTGIEI